MIPNKVQKSISISPLSLSPCLETKRWELVSVGVLSWLREAISARLHITLSKTLSKTRLHDHWAGKYKCLLIRKIHSQHHTPLHSADTAYSQQVTKDTLQVVWRFRCSVRHLWPLHIYEYLNDILKRTKSPCTAFWSSGASQRSVKSPHTGLRW